MPTSRLTPLLETKLDALGQSGRRKGTETVVRGVLPPRDGKGPRYLLEGYGDRPFLRMNSNSYLGLSLDRAVIAAEEEAVRLYGADRASAFPAALGVFLSRDSSSGGRGFQGVARSFVADLRSGSGCGRETC